MAEHAARWIKTSLATGPAERRAFEEAARRCYVYAGIPWHGNVVWMSSPLTLGIATLLIQARHDPSGSGLAQRLRCAILPCLGEAAWQEVQNAISASCTRGSGADRLSPWAEGSVVTRAIISTVRDAPVAALARSFGPWGVLHDRVRRTVEGAIQKLVLDAVAEISQSVDRAVQSAVRELYGEADGELRAAVTATMTDVFSRTDFILKGPLDLFPTTPHPSCTSFLREVCALTLPACVWDKSCAYEQTMRTAGWWYPYRDVLLVCERPREIHREPARPSVLSATGVQQLHSAHGAAMSWPDGWAIHAFHGCLVPAWIIEKPQAITVSHIERSRNAEVRRVMIERYGWERYMRDCGARVVDSVPLDHPIRGLRGARLLRKYLPEEVEPIVYLEMVNSTAEPDGTCKRYFERINPYAYGGDATRFCHAAMASRWMYRDANGVLQRTFQRWQDYQPSVES
jgi:hypothetical protein